MKSHFSKLYRSAALLFTALIPLSFAFAQVKLQNPIKYGTIDDFLLAVVQVVVQYGAILVVLFLVFAGFQFVTAQGNTEKIEHAKKMLVWVVVGAFVLLGVYVIRAAVCGTLNQLRAPGTPEFCKVAPRTDRLLPPPVKKVDTLVPPGPNPDTLQ